MMRFDSNQAWKDAASAVSANRDVLLALAGVFFVLPSFAFTLLYPQPEPPAGACAAPDLQYLVGQPESVLQTMKFGGDTRIIRPGMAVTMDYREDRLNIEIDAAGTISRVTCG